MNDRVVDRAAAHATPAELAVRDWLLVGLSLATGMYEAICFLTFGKVFTAAQTGNLVLLGIGVAGTHQPAGPNAVTVIISLAAFAVGAALRCRSARRSTAIRNPKMTMSSRPDRFRGRHGRRCLRRRLDAQPRPSVRAGGASGRNGRRHRDRLGGAEAASHLRPGQ